MIPAICLVMAGLALMACGLSPKVLRIFAAYALAQADAVENYKLTRHRTLAHWRMQFGVER
jgi:ferritin-like metal-binding protein YciE